jgi:hypothetical protein
MAARDEFDLNQQSAYGVHPRAVGSPLPRGGSRVPPGVSDSDLRPIPAPPPGRTLTSGTPSPSEGSDPGSTAQRVVSALRSAIPFVQRLLPLLDGNVAAAVANVFTPQPPRPDPPVDLAPIHESVADLQVQHQELRDRVIEQNDSIRKVEDQLSMVREATDRNTLEQQELMEDLKAVGRKVNFVAMLALALLAVSVLLNLVLYLHIQRVLP